MNRTKILAVDDEAGVLNMITQVCREYDITAETSSLKALEIMKSEEFGIFIVDYQMPRVNGIEFLEEIQHVYSGRHYVSIFCTAYGTIHLFKPEFVRGLFRYYIEKPFDSDVLKETVERATVTLERIQTSEEYRVTSS